MLWPQLKNSVGTYPWSECPPLAGWGFKTTLFSHDSALIVTILQWAHADALRDVTHSVITGLQPL